jgi:serine/threonine-protein kinase
MCGTELPPGVTVCPNDGTTMVSAMAATAPTSVVDPMIGRHVGEYIIQRAIGGGGMGVVYEGLQPLIGRRAAIKILRPQIAGDPEHIQRLLAEARATNSIRHRGIIDIYGFGELEGYGHYVVMEYLDGYSVEASLAQRGRLPESEVLWIMDEVSDALDSAHEAGIIHRDIKPSNIFVVTAAKGIKYIKLLDFGLAKEMLPGPLTPQTYVGSIVGTPEYLSPEQAMASKVGPATDVYSLGVVAYELLTGKLPFLGGTPMETAMMHRNTPVPRLSALRPDITPALDTLIFQMMAKPPEDRPKTAVLVQARVREIQKEITTAATSLASQPPERLFKAVAPRNEAPVVEPKTSRVPAVGGQRVRPWMYAVAAGAVVGIGAVVAAVHFANGSAKPSSSETVASVASSASSTRMGRAPDPTDPAPSSASDPPPAPTPERIHAPIRHPVKEASPTRQMLLRRIDELERRVKHQPGTSSGALAFLASERVKAQEAEDVGRRRSIAALLSRWENKNLGGP